ncbi:MAG: Fe-S cluster assembly sulfur transfer protein SufU [Verrucomicrobiota bacterium]|jgi:nitrogen fixation NifU-like protein
MPDDANNDLSDLYQEVILDHNRNPRNFRVVPGANRQAEGDNPLCGDHFTIFLKLDKDVIADVGFQGAGCAISKASASLMTEAIKGKTVAEAQKYFTDFQQMLATGRADEDALGSLCALGGVHKFPMRVKCAILSWHAMLAALPPHPAPSTEKP